MVVSRRGACGKNEMENICTLDFGLRIGGIFGWDFDTQGSGIVQYLCTKAAIIASCLDLSGGMDDFVCTYGDRRCQDRFITGDCWQIQESQFDDCPIDPEFLLATTVF